MPGQSNLNLDEVEIRQAGNRLTELLAAYERSIPAQPAMPKLNPAVLEELLAQPFPEQGIGIEQLFRKIIEVVLPNCTSIAHPRFLAYVLGPSNGIAPFADAIASALNQNCNFWQLSPAASVIERKVVSWLAELFGYPPASGGLLTSGGSMATLAAMSVALHDKFSGDFRKSGLQSTRSPMVVYTSEEAHRCVEKDAAILGLGLENVHKIPADEEFRLRVDLLEAAIRKDRTDGRQPFCVVATAGTVNTGAIDPLSRIADICERENLWLHLDGAYGALFVLSERIRPQLLPCARADSIALDPHKLLFAPLEAGCLVVRDREKLKRPFHFESSYLTIEDDPLFTNYLEYGPQLSRSFKAFKIWCSLEVFGIEAFRDAVERMLDLSQYMGERIRSEPLLELLAPVNLTAVCFRFRNDDGGRSRRVLEKLTEEGTALLGPVRIQGRYGIRACINNYRTGTSDIDLIIDRILELGAS